jgi:hypothetical protein
LCLARGELQRSADAAAIAAAWELVDEDSLSGNADEALLAIKARDTATQFAGLNPVLRGNPSLGTDDVVVGHLTDPTNPSGSLDSSGLLLPNAVQVRVRRTSSQNGEVPFFLAKILGVDSMATQAQATAMLITSFRGFQAPSDGSNLEIMPFALDQQTWNAMLMEGVGQDRFTWDPEEKEVFAGPDGILEINLYPHGTGPPGNRGTVDIGGNSNSTDDIARQIIHGISQQDMEYHGGKLELDSNGEMELNGDTGISAGIKDELTTIIGKKRIVPVFKQVAGPGNNAQYTIVQFAGVRIMEVRLTGADSRKRVMIQPANVVAKGGIPSDQASTCHFVYSPVWLVR